MKMQKKSCDSEGKRKWVPYCQVFVTIWDEKCRTEPIHSESKRKLVPYCQVLLGFRYDILLQYAAFTIKLKGQDDNWNKLSSNSRT